MTTRLLTLLAAGVLAITPGTLHGQLKTSIGISGGIGVPTAGLENDADAGYNAAAHLALGAPLMPIGIRLEGAFNRFNLKSSAIADGRVDIRSGTVNATVALGTLGASPYLIGGVGMYNRKITGLTSTSETAAGVNGGVGLRFPLGGASTFIEARYHAMLGSDARDTDMKFVPITFGISF